jgi:hypothetical protein
MTGYLFLFSSLLGTSLTKLQGRQKLFLAGIAIFLFSALRFGFSYDYFLYVRCALTDFRHQEPLSAFLEFFAGRFGVGWYFILSSLWIAFFVCKGIAQSSKNKMLSLFFFVGFPYLFYHDLSTVRQGMAVSVIFYAIATCQYEKKKQFALILLAMCCHASAIVGFLMLLPWEKLRLRTLWLMFISSFFAQKIFLLVASYLHFDLYLWIKLIQYIETGMIEESDGTFRVLMLFSLFFLLMLQYRRMRKIDANNAYYLNLACLGICLYNVFSISIPVAERFCTFFFSSVMLLIPDLLKSFKIGKYGKLGFEIACCASFFAFILQAHNGSVGTANRFLPYTTWLGVENWGQYVSQ